MLCPELWSGAGLERSRFMTNTPSCVWVSHVDHYSSLASKKSTRRYMHSPNLVKYRLTREEHHLKKDQEGRAPTDQTKQNVPKMQ
jgi:hypothetical protein